MAAPASWTGKLTPGPLAPGRGAVVTLRLARRDGSRPAAVRTGTTPPLRATVFAVLLIAVLGLYVAFRRREISLGRYEPLPPADSIDEAWLEKNVFSLLPEEAGALWDEDIGAPEVAAVLARLTAEGKISAKVEGKKLTLRRLVEIDRFSGYERELVEALFFAGQETDTDRIKEHYRSKGFDPASKIKKGLESKLERHPDFQDSSPRPGRLPTALLLLAGAGVLGLLALTKAEDPRPMIGLLILHAVIAVAALVPARLFQARLSRLDLYSWTFLWAPLLFLYLSFQGIWSGGESSLFLLAGVLLIRIGITNNIFNVAKTRDGPKKIARRKSLAAARAVLQETARDPVPEAARWLVPLHHRLRTGQASRPLVSRVRRGNGSVPGARPSVFRLVLVFLRVRRVMDGRRRIVWRSGRVGILGSSGGSDRLGRLGALLRRWRGGGGGSSGGGGGGGW